MREIIVGSPGTIEAAREFVNQGKKAEALEAMERSVRDTIASEYQADVLRFARRGFEILWKEKWGDD